MHPPAWHRWRRPNYATSRRRVPDWQHSHCCVIRAKAWPGLPPAGTHPRFSGRIGIGAESPEPTPKLRPLPDERARVFQTDKAAGQRGYFGPRNATQRCSWDLRIGYQQNVRRHLLSLAPTPLLTQRLTKYTDQNVAFSLFGVIGSHWLGSVRFCEAFEQETSTSFRHREAQLQV